MTAIKISRVLYHETIRIANYAFEIDYYCVTLNLLMSVDFSEMKKLLLLLVFCSWVQAKPYVPELEKYLNHLNSVKGVVTDFTPHGTQPGLTFDVAAANNCGDCHSVVNTDDVHFTPSATWWGSMMANSTRDPLFWAAVDIANQDVPGVGDFCIRCHSPMGFYKGNTKNGLGNMDYANGCMLDGTVSMAQESANNDYQGINCHFCHRIDEQGPGGEGFIVKNANVWLDDQTCDNPDGINNFGPCRKGPYNPPIFDLHAWEYSTFLSQGELCGACHNVSSPEISVGGALSYAKTLIDESGVDTGLAMPVERTYAEWKSSLFSDLIYTDGFGGDVVTLFPNLTTGQTCQNCHMPNSTHVSARASTIPDPGSRTGDLRTHEFAGGNSWMPQVLKAEYGADLNLPGQNADREAAFDRTTAYALDMLQNKSALVETSIVSQSPTQAQINVKVTNLTGHKLPTGYPEGRRMWLNVKVTDNVGTDIYESGAYDDSTAVLTQDADIKIYETKPGIWDSQSNTCVTDNLGEELFHFVLNNCVAKDTRIPPLGFRGGSDVEIKPIGINYPTTPGDSSTLVNYDVTGYTFTIPGGVVYPLTVEATLKYQTTSKEYIDFLDSNSTTPSENTLCNRSQTTGPANQSRGAFMKALWENNGKSAPVDMVTSQLEIISE